MFSSRSEAGGGKSRLWAWCVLAIAIQALAVAWGLGDPQRAGFANKKQNFTFNDIRLYHNFVSPMLEGRWPYRDYRVEYPILAIPIFAAPLMVGRALDVYKYAFVAEMFLVNAALVVLVARRVGATLGGARVAGGLAWYTAYFVVLCPLVVLRFDLAPALLGFAATGLLASGREGRGGLVAGLGTLVKLTPGLVVPPILAMPGPWRPRVRGLATFGLTVGLGVAAWWWLGRDGLWESIRYHGKRGLEVGSLPASSYMVVHNWLGVPISTRFDFGGMNVSGPHSEVVARFSPLIQAALLGVVVIQARRVGGEDRIRLAAAALLAYLIPGKVFSPQFMIWLIPFLPAIGGPGATAARVVFLACCALTTAIFPFRFGALLKFHGEPVAILVARNLGLVVLFLILIRRSPGGITPTQSSPEACS